MHFDLPTLDAMGAFGVVTAGAVLLVAWSQNLKAEALAFWGLANLVNASGIACLVMATAFNQPACTFLGGTLLTSGAGLIWKAARAFEAKPAPIGIALLGAIVIGLASSFPETRVASWPVGIIIGSTYLIASAIAFGLGRQEHLRARWPIVFLLAVHAALLLIGLSTPPGELPDLSTWFGLIHFENIIFPLGTAVFLLALVKERNEAASRRAARIDSLTGIANRGAFMEIAEKIVYQCRRENASVSVIMCDLDSFKAVNDVHGHAMGDAVIQKFCKTVLDVLSPDDVFGRLGGEEFALVLPRVSIEAAYVRAERIRISFEDCCHFVEGHQIGATVSCGVSVTATTTQTLSELLKLSDQALYCAKADGRNRVKRANQPKPYSSNVIAIRVA